MGEAGDGGPVIAILGEYDALPGLSQEAGMAEHRPLPGDGFGHGCGHNLLGSASLLAATAVKDWLAAHGMPGRVRYYGCPAEEGGAAKGFMVRAGAFDDVDIAISWHPAAFCRRERAARRSPTRASISPSPAAPSHAAAAPHLGRTALDAVELMNVGVNYMREHMPSDARIHYAILDAGGIAPNVVQARAKVRYLIRARDLPELTPLVARVRKIADGAALMTETTVDGAGDQRRVQPARQHAAGTGDARQPGTPRPAAVRRRGPRLRRADPGDAERARTSPAPSAASACRCAGTSPLCDADRAARCASARRWSARPMSAT